MRRRARRGCIHQRHTFKYCKFGGFCHVCGRVVFGICSACAAGVQYVCPLWSEPQLGCWFAVHNSINSNEKAEEIHRMAGL
jgi:hypothetical protein